MIDLLRWRIDGLPQERLLFDQMRDRIEQNLKHFGIASVLREMGYDLEDKKLIVSREPGYTTRLASIDRDLDPLASPLYSTYELGLITEEQSPQVPALRHISGEFIAVSEALHGQSATLSEFGEALSPFQRSLIEGSISTLSNARLAKILPSLNKSLNNLEF